MSNSLDNIAPQDFAQVSEAGAVADTDLLPILHDGQARKVSVGTLLAGAGGGLPDGFNVEKGAEFWGPSWVLYTTDDGVGISLFTGDRTFTGPYQWIILDPTEGNLSVSIYCDDGNGNSSTVTVSPTAITLNGLPTADPLVVGQLYSDGVPSADTPKVLKISGGTT